MPSDVDCYFGDTTKATTKKWQSAHSLDDDGIVGPKTFGKADDKLSISSAGVITYDGTKHDLKPFYRLSSGRRYTTASNGVDYYFDYTNATICSAL